MDTVFFQKQISIRSLHVMGKTDKVWYNIIRMVNVRLLAKEQPMDTVFVGWCIVYNASVTNTYIKFYVNWLKFLLTVSIIK
jgi:hypothetical protein